jgi:hypothetical protein
METLGSSLQQHWTLFHGYLEKSHKDNVTQKFEGRQVYWVTLAYTPIALLLALLGLETHAMQ